MTWKGGGDEGRGERNRGEREWEGGRAGEREKRREREGRVDEEKGE